VSVLRRVVICSSSGMEDDIVVDRDLSIALFSPSRIVISSCGDSVVDSFNADSEGFRSGTGVGLRSTALRVLARLNVLKMRLPRRRSLSSSVRNLFSNALRLMWTMNEETNMVEPMIVSKNMITCCQVFNSDKLTVLRPDSVMADIQRKIESKKLISNAGVEEPQKTIPERRHVPMK